MMYKTNVKCMYKIIKTIVQNNEKSTGVIFFSVIYINYQKEHQKDSRTWYPKLFFQCYI
jgi:hypothetical protein